MQREELLLAQYRECWREISDYDRLIWQTPAVTVTIISFFAIAYLQANDNLYAKIFLTLGALIVSVGQLQTLLKHRFLQEVRVSDFAFIQESLKPFAPVEIRWSTDRLLQIMEDGHYPDVAANSRFLVGRSSFRIMALIILMLGSFWGLLLAYHIAERLIPITFLVVMLLDGVFVVDLLGGRPSRSDV